jgi:2-C-methyl-D-erythritol 4-phosphate cytidylyltransferase
MRTVAVVIAAGRGTRFGGYKQFQPLGGRRVIDWAVSAAARSCDGVVLVLPPGVEWDGAPVHAVVAGGATHAESARLGVAAVPPEAMVIVMGTASHPLTTADLYGATIDAVFDGADAAISARPIADCLKHMAPDRTTVLGSVDKSSILLCVTPTAFRADLLRSEIAKGVEVPEELELIERAGGRVVVVPGEPTNIHITEPAELVMAEALLPLVRHRL